MYLLDFLDESVDYIFFKEKDLNPTGHFVKPNKFTSHEIVRIVNPSEKHKNFENFKGFVTGTSTDRNGMWSYGVDFLQNQFDCRDCICEEHELESTGEFVKKEDYYPGESVKVIVHPDGRGELKESWLERGINNGIRDKFGNEWRKGPSRTLGEAFEKEVADKMGITQTALSQIEPPNSNSYFY